MVFSTMNDMAVSIVNCHKIEQTAYYSKTWETYSKSWEAYSKTWEAYKAG